MVVSTKADLLHNKASFEQRAKELAQQKKKEQEELKQNRKSPFKNFYQINKKNSLYLRSCLKENPKALELLLFIFDHMDRYNAVVCSYKVFQEVLNASRQTASKCVKYLKEHGFIYVYRSGTSNVYVANDNLAWNSWGTNKKYCEFPANVVLSASEQEKIKIKTKKLTTTNLANEEDSFVDGTKSETDKNK